MTAVLEHRDEVELIRRPPGVCHMDGIVMGTTLCGEIAPDEPYCCDGEHPSCGRPECEACRRVLDELVE